MGRGLSRRCRGGVAAVALVSFSVKPATVTKKLAGWGGTLGRLLRVVLPVKRDRSPDNPNSPGDYSSCALEE